MSIKLIRVWVRVRLAVLIVGIRVRVRVRVRLAVVFVLIRVQLRDSLAALEQGISPDSASASVIGDRDD